MNTYLNTYIFTKPHSIQSLDTTDFSVILTLSIMQTILSLFVRILKELIFIDVTDASSSWRPDLIPKSTKVSIGVLSFFF